MNREPAQTTAGEDSTDLLGRQQRRHLLALYIAACNYARQLEGALLLGTSPTGYGAPLTPLSADEAEAVLAPVRDSLAQMRHFLAQYAPRELAEHETLQPRNNTVVWASNLLERLRQIAESLSPRRLRRYGEAVPRLEPSAQDLRRELLAALAEARRSLAGSCSDEPDSDTP